MFGYNHGSELDFGIQTALEVLLSDLFPWE